MNNNNTIYKDTPLGKIPSDWKLKSIEEIVKIYIGLTYTPYYTENGVPFVSIKDLNEHSIDFLNTKFISREEFDKSTDNAKPRKGDILFGRVGTIGNPILLETEIEFCIFVSLGYFRLIDNSCVPKYIINWMKSPIFTKQVENIVAGSSQKNLNTGWLKNFKIPIPPVSEQIFIAQILSLMDSSINKNNQLIAKKELQKKWLMYQLLTGRRRIKKFTKSELSQKTSLGELPVDWKIDAIKNILSPVRKSFIPKQDEKYQQIGIRSHTKGLFYKEKVTGAALGDKSVFWIEPDCFIVNIVFAWEHAIAKTSEKEIGMIASHRFPMYKPKEGVLDLDFLLYFFKSLRGKHLLGLASPGGAGRNKTLGQSEFVKLLLPIPSFEEQTAIAQVLQAADKEIQLLKTKTEKLREQKKGLMQVLLTGKKRLSYDI